MLDYGTQKLGRIGQFRFWCQKVLPAVYDDSLSYYELLAKVIEKLNEVITLVDSESNAFQELADAIEELQDMFEDFKDGGFEEYYEELLDKWITENMTPIIEKAMKMVWFGLTMDGHFVAYIPDSWKDITFDTGYDETLNTYGRLILRYYVDNEGEIVDQTPEGRN